MKRIVVVVLLVLIGWNGYLSYEVYRLKENPNNLTNTNDSNITSGRSEITSNVSELVEKSENKVVTVASVYGVQEIGSGSGAIYKIDGTTIYVITNYHVIEGGDSANVSFADGTSAKAEIIGKDALTDLALLKMTTDSKLEAFTIGDSSLVKKGEYVIAMGSPLGIEYQGSVSGGLISGINRSVEISTSGSGTPDWNMSVLQIDAAINPGNSGGPLINMAGELIGINSMKIAQTDVEGFGFAIPINEVLPIVTQLEKDGKVTRPSLGVSAVDVSQLSMRQRIRLNIEDESGIIITNVTNDGPAQKAGIIIGDIIKKMGDVEIANMKQFRQTLYTKNIGDTIVLEVLREETIETIEVTLR